MKEPVNKTRKKKAKRSQWRFWAVVAACFLVAVFAIPWWLSKPSPDAPVGQVPVVANRPEPAEPAENNRLENRGEAAVQVIDDGEDGIVAEHEAGVVLAKLPEGVSADELNEAIAQLDYLAQQTITADDAVFGWVELSLAEGVAVHALQALGQRDA